MKASKKSIPRQYAYVKFIKRGLTKAMISSYPSAFQSQLPLIFLGEIPNMPGHCIVMEATFGLVDRHHVGYHTDNFVELTEDEL